MSLVVLTANGIQSRFHQNSRIIRGRMENIVRQRITRLSHGSRAYLDCLRAFSICMVAVFFSVVSIVSVQISLVENLPSRLDYPSAELKFLFLLFIFTIYAIAIVAPIFLGFQIFSVLTITALMLLCTFNAFILHALGLTDFGGAIFFLVIGVIIGWFSEIAWAICVVSVYSFWKSRGYFFVLLTCSLAIVFLTTQLANLVPESEFDVVLTTCLSAIFILVVSILIAKKALQDEPAFAWLKQRAIAFSAIGGISFKDLEIKNLSFEGLDLGHIDFRGSKIYRTSFRGAKNLEFSCVKGTILDNPKVRKLLAMPKMIEISEKNFRDVNLTGANLSGLDLEGVDFSGANLTDVDVSSANLTGANFTKAQLFNADFSGACLDEICICDWSINKETCFNDVRCNWVYLEQGKHGSREKKPDIGEFQPGEFEKWIRQLQDTVDLLLREQPNVRALISAIERVAHSYGGIDPSRFSVESKGDNLYVARIGTTREADKEKVASKIVINYNSINELMIQGESNRLLLNSEGGYMETQNQSIKAGGNLDISSGTRVSIGGDVTGSSITFGDLNGRVSNTIQSIQDIAQGETQELADILGALQKAINTDETLSEPQKVQAMEAVAVLAEESQKPKEKRLSKMCAMAVNALKGITSTLSDISNLANLLRTHLPTLVGLLGMSL